MKKTVSIQKDDGRIYFGVEILKEYEGEVDTYIDKACILIRNPKATIDQLLRSIDILKNDLKLRKEMKEK